MILRLELRIGKVEAPVVPVETREQVAGLGLPFGMWIVFFQAPTKTRDQVGVPFEMRDAVIGGLSKGRICRGLVGRIVVADADTNTVTRKHDLLRGAMENALGEAAFNGKLLPNRGCGAN